MKDKSREITQIGLDDNQEKIVRLKCFKEIHIRSSLVSTSHTTEMFQKTN